MRSLALVLAMLGSAAAISFTMKGAGTKCLQEDVEKDVLVVGEFEVDSDPAVEVTFEVRCTVHTCPATHSQHDLAAWRPTVVLGQVTDSRDHAVYRKEDAEKGKFAFTSDDYDVFELCFQTELHDGAVAVRWQCNSCRFLSCYPRLLCLMCKSPAAERKPDAETDIHLTIKMGAEARSYDEVGYRFCRGQGG